jgi:ornithine carbamoyltransferase
MKIPSGGPTVKKDFLCLTDWSREELEQIFDLTRELT